MSMALIATLGLFVTSCEDPVPAPTVDISYIVDGYDVDFTATVTDASTFAWTFGDGLASTEQNPSHTYAGAGTYTVTCTVTGEGGTESATVDITIDAAPVTLVIEASVDGYDVTFTATAEGAESFAWDFGDSETSSEQNPVHTYVQSGTYTVSCTASSADASDTQSTDVTIEPSPSEMLTGGPAMADGKTWVMDPLSQIGIFHTDEDMTLQEYLPAGIIGLLGAPEEYEDEFTFKHDGTYSHDVKNDSVIANTIFAMLNGLEFKALGDDAVVLAPFTPVAATFTFDPELDMTLEVVPDEDVEESVETTWTGHNGVLEILDGEFAGVLDGTRKYLVYEISADKMVLGIFISAVTEGSKLGMPSHILEITFVPKASE